MRMPLTVDYGLDLTNDFRLVPSLTRARNATAKTLHNPGSRETPG